MPCAHVNTRPDVDPRVPAGLFGCVCAMHVCVRVRTWINVPVPVLFGVHALCTCSYPSGRVPTVKGRYSHVDLCTSAYASGLGSTLTYRHLSVCTPCTRVATRPDVIPRGPFWCVRPVRVCARLRTWIHEPVQRPFQCLRPVRVGVHDRTWIHVPVNTLFGAYALCNVPARLWTRIHVPVPALFGV